MPSTVTRVLTLKNALEEQMSFLARKGASTSDLSNF